jgi:hypothetical protein
MPLPARSAAVHLNGGRWAREPDCATHWHRVPHSAVACQAEAKITA